MAGIKTRAVRKGNFYIVNGEKKFITGGMRSDFFTVAVRTGDSGLGGVSLLLLEKGTNYLCNAYFFLFSFCVCFVSNFAFVNSFHFVLRHAWHSITSFEDSRVVDVDYYVYHV